MIDEKKLLEEIDYYIMQTYITQITEHRGANYCYTKIKELVCRQPKVGEWIPFTERKTDEEEKEVYGCDYILNCKLPDDGQEIIVSYASGCVDTDIFMKDGDECYLESGCEFINEAVAWQPLPEPFKE